MNLYLGFLLHTSWAEWKIFKLMDLKPHTYDFPFFKIISLITVVFSLFALCFYAFLFPYSHFDMVSGENRDKCICPIHI